VADVATGFVAALGPRSSGGTATPLPGTAARRISGRPIDARLQRTGGAGVIGR
jgi:hypothetical protein